jgi:hypothetical protein
MTRRREHEGGFKCRCKKPKKRDDRKRFDSSTSSSSSNGSSSNSSHHQQVAAVQTVTTRNLPLLQLSRRVTNLPTAKNQKNDAKREHLYDEDSEDDDDDDDDGNQAAAISKLLASYTATESSYDYSAPPAAREEGVSLAALKREVMGREMTTGDNDDGDAAMSNLFNRYRSTQSSQVNASANANTNLSDDKISMDLRRELGCAICLKSLNRYPCTVDITFVALFEMVARKNRQLHTAATR